MAPGRPRGARPNRSSVIDNAGTPTTYGYDNADRLVSSSDAAVGTPAYDSHGNTTTLGTQSLVYDGADRHMETKVNATTLSFGLTAPMNCPGSADGIPRVSSPRMPPG